MMHVMPRTPKSPVFGVQTTLDLFAAPAPRAPERQKKEPCPPVVTPCVMAADAAAAVDLTPEPPFSIAADHYAALAKKA